MLRERVNRFKNTRLHLALLQRIRLTELRSGLVGHVLQRDSRECLAAENPITLLVDNPPEPTREGGRIAQRVNIVDDKGEIWEALYTLETQADGSLKITGCSLLKAGQSV